MAQLAEKVESLCLFFSCHYESYLWAFNEAFHFQGCVTIYLRVISTILLYLRITQRLCYYKYLKTKTKIQVHHLSIWLQLLK